MRWQGGAAGPHIAPTVQRAAGDGERAGMKERAGRSRWRVEGLGIYAYRGWRDPERDRETDERVFCIVISLSFFLFLPIQSLLESQVGDALTSSFFPAIFHEVCYEEPSFNIMRDSTS